MNRSNLRLRGILGCLVLATASLSVARAHASELGASVYPDLMGFEQARALHQAGELERAKAGFRHLAELGDPEARFNLGLMLLKGEGGLMDRAEGVAWARWAVQERPQLAAPVLERIEPTLTATEEAAAAETLDRLREQFDIEKILAGADAPRAATTGRYACIVERMEWVPALYPRDAFARGEQGAANLAFIVAPDGTVGGVDVFRAIDSRDTFDRVALDAARKWHANACPGESYDDFVQPVSFVLADPGEARLVSSTEVRRVDLLVSAARAGQPDAAYAAALLAQSVPDLVGLEPGEAEAFLLKAALAGLPEARFSLANDLSGAAESSLRRRWALLAARQGYAPALFAVAHDREMPVAERKAALMRAAEAGFGPAVFMSARLLSAHPEASSRDGARALSLTESLSRKQLRDDMLLAQARAMALAETGQYREAAKLQQRVVRVLADSGRSTAGAATRLAVYEAGAPWRDPLLLNEFGPADAD